MDHQEWTIQRKQKGPSRMDNPEKTEGTIKNGQSRENKRDHQEWTIQRKQMGPSRMDQSRENRRNHQEWINPETLLTCWYELKPKNNTEK
jgi:hypothetical protein